MNFFRKILPLILLYLLLLLPGLIQEPENGSGFDMVFAGVFLSIFMLIFLGGFFLYKKILSALGVRVLSASGDIVKTDFGHNISNRLWGILVNIAGDTVFNLIFVLFLIFFAVVSASLASDMVRAV